MLLHYPYEVRQASEYFDEIQDGKITSATLAKHIVEPKSAHFDPSQLRTITKLRCRIWKRK
jgi:DNA end-binding protein Ku